MPELAVIAFPPARRSLIQPACRAGPGPAAGAREARQAVSASPSARRLAATRRVDLFLERIGADGADDDISAHHVARRAVEAERLGELEALLDRGLHLVARHVLLDLGHVEADFLGDGEGTRLVRLSAAAEQLLMEFEIFLAGLVLHAHGRRDLRRLDRTFTQYRELLKYKFELPVVLHQFDHVAHGTLAVAAIVVEELDHGDIALRIAQRHLAG